MIVGEENDGFEFYFDKAPIPDFFCVYRWPRECLGEAGVFEQGEAVEYDEKHQWFADKYAVPHMETGYIYSIYAGWGEYYRDDSFLATDNPEDVDYEWGSAPIVPLSSWMPMIRRAIW